MSKKRRAATIAGCALATVALTGAATSAEASSSQARPANAGNCTTAFVFLRTFNNQYLDVKGNGTAGTPVDAWYYNGNSNQQWCFQSNGTDGDGQQGGYFIHPGNENGNECLDDSNYPDLYVLTCNDSTNQLWDANPGISTWIKSRDYNDTVGISPNGFGKLVTLTSGNGWVWYQRS